MELKRIGLVGLMAVVGCAAFVQAETLKIVGNEKTFDLYVDVTYGWANSESVLSMREYWNNDYQGFGAYDCRPFIRVDLSDLPENATIDSVSMNFKVISAGNSIPQYVDLWQVHPFTEDMDAWTYDGVNPWPTVDPNYGVSYFDGVDGFGQTPADKHLAESDIAIDWDVWDQWFAFTSDTLTDYVQAQSEEVEGSRYAYFELSYQDDSSEWIELYSNTSVAEAQPYMEINYTVGGVVDIPGDANHDGVVNVGDLGILAGNYGTLTDATWEMGDFNGDGAVNVGDLGILAGNYGTTAAAAVPEPATLSLLGMGIFALLRRKR
jgi:hypothetical protein